jgi:diguanylate cyclase (GGDEF)-like protein
MTDPKVTPVYPEVTIAYMPHQPILNRQIDGPFKPILKTVPTRADFLDWSKLPDLIAVMLLAWAFASVVRRSRALVSGNWLGGWLLVVLHFSASMFLPAQGFAGILALIVTLTSLAWAGILFMKAALPYRKEVSSYWMLLTMLSVYSIYISLLVLSAPEWLMRVSAILLVVGPFVLTLRVARRFSHRLRWFTVALNFALCLFLLLVQSRPGVGADLALNAVFFTIYLGCCIHFWYIYPRATAGAFITIGGFFAWAAVFAISPLVAAYLPYAHVETEVWNLPKYVVAVGMILLMLEDQIGHNKHLALHDELTGLPNRRLFQDRLANALERARRTGTQTALLVLDLNHFKSVNDTLGHHVGDLLLQHVARLFGRRVRRSDTVARTGGDEFSVVLESPISRAEATHVGRTLQELLKEPMQLEDRLVPIGVSLGVAIFPDDAEDMETLCITADLRMYENKRSNEESSGELRAPGTKAGRRPPSPPRSGISLAP